MPSPSAQDYHRAVQELRSASSDEEIREGQVERGPMGFPACYAGNFAYVYKVHCPTTGKTWAVKCFTRNVSGLGNRYREIRDHLKQVKLPYAVEFDYVEPGIRVAGQWRPFLKMEWVEGWTLDRLIAEYLGQPEKLRRLADFVVKMEASLRRAGIAHGDLQHQHILFAPTGQPGKLSPKLIDYDGMYVPALAGIAPAQTGHAAYQHPQTLSSGMYGPEADRFSFLVIYCAIQCVAAGGRELWERHYNEDTLLIEARDFAEREESALFRQLWQLPDPTARRIVGHLLLAAEGPPEAVPRLDQLVDGSEVRELTDLERNRVERLTSGSARAEPETPMCAALLQAQQIVQGFITEFPRSFPPIVLNISGGKVTDGDPETAASALCDVATEDGSVLLFNTYLSSSGDDGFVQFPASEDRLGDQNARQLFRMSSPLPPGMVTEARNSGFQVADGAKGFAVNRDLSCVVQFLRMGTAVETTSGVGYSAEISLANPICVLLLVDQSETMEAACGRPASGTKAREAADFINHVLYQLVTRTSKGDGVLDRCFVSVVGYGPHVGPALGGELAGKDLIPISLIAENWLRVEERKQQLFDEETGEMMEQVYRVPIWYDSAFRVNPEHERRDPETAQHEEALGGPKPLVFISAKSEDYTHAQRYYDYLTSQGIRAFLGAVSLAELGVSDYRDAIDTALEEARHMVVVTSSRQNVRSSWVTAEWGLFVNEKRSDRKSGNLITVTVGDMPIEDLPPSLRYYEVIPDGPGSFEKVLGYVSYS